MSETTTKVAVLITSKKTIIRLVAQLRKDQFKVSVKKLKEKDRWLITGNFPDITTYHIQPEDTSTD